MTILEVYWALNSFNNFTALLILLIDCSKSFTWLLHLILTGPYELVVVTVPFYRWGNWGLAEGMVWPRSHRWVVSDKLAFECRECDSSAETLTYRCYIASIRNRDTARVGQLPRHKPRLLPFRLPQETLGGLSCPCDAVGSCWGSEGFWEEKVWTHGKRKEQTKEICIKMSLPLTQCVCVCQLQGRFQIFLVSYIGWKGFVSTLVPGIVTLIYLLYRFGFF